MTSVVCQKCGSDTADLASHCRACGAPLHSTPPATTVNCTQCSTPMDRTTKVNRDMSLQLLGVVVFFGGVWVMIAAPFGLIIGLAMMIIAARLGYSKQPVWMCPRCGYFFERAK